MNNFDFDICNYIILQNKESAQYYAAIKNNWENAEDQYRANLNENKSDPVEVETQPLTLNSETHQYQLIDETCKMLYTNLRGVLIKIN